MTPSKRLTPRVIGLWVWGILTVVTSLFYFFVQMPEYPRRALPLLWCLFSWNFYAYAFDKGMLPTMIELDGQGKGKPGWRTFWFWLDALIYGALLVVIALVP